MRSSCSFHVSNVLVSYQGYTTKNPRRFVLCETLTCVILSADARIASLPASADSSVHAGIRVTQVNLDFAVISSKSSRTAATQACDWMDGPEECGWGGDEGGGAVEAENTDALHVVLTRLAKAHVIVEWENLPKHTVSHHYHLFYAFFHI